MTNRIATYTIVFLTIVSSGAHAQKVQLRPCRLTSQARPVQAGQKPIRITASLLNGARNEYKLKANSAVTVEVKMKTDSELKLEIYRVKPPTRLKINELVWSQTFAKGEEYLLVVSNCYGTTKGTYQIDFTMR